MPKLTALGHIGLAFETTYGTAATPLVYFPYATVKADTQIKKITDDAVRTTLAQDYAVYNATQSGNLEIDGNVYSDNIGYFLKAILGQDTASGVSPNFTHIFKIVNAQSPSLTISDMNGISERQYLGSVMSELGFKFDTQDVFSYAAKLLSYPASAPIAETIPAYAATTPFMGFQLTAKLGGAANLNLTGGEINIKRNTELIFTANNTVLPTKFNAGQIEVTGKMTFVPESDTEFGFYLNGTQQSLNLNLAINVNRSIDFTFNQVDFSNAQVDRSGEYAKISVDWRAVYNTTDAGNCTITLKNATATY
jgi:hypothetical protein